MQSIIKMTVGDRPLSNILPATLFALLSPGVLLTVGGPFAMVRPMPGTANLRVVLIHAIVYAIALNQLKRLFPQYY